MKSNSYSLSGLMGACIWAYEKGVKHDAEDLFNAVLEHYKEINTTDLMRGFAGVGWGIEYLVQNRFIDIETDEVLEKIDNALFRLRRQRNNMYLNSGCSLFDYGLYYLIRTKGGMQNDTTKVIIKKTILAFLVDECERMFFTHRFSEGPTPEVNITYLNSVNYFLLETHRLGVSPRKTFFVFETLMDYYSVFLMHNTPSVEEITSLHLLEYARGIYDEISNEKYIVLQQSFRKRIAKLGDQVLIAISRLGWDMLFYREIFLDNRCPQLAILDTNMEMLTESELLGVKFHKLFTRSKDAQY